MSDYELKIEIDVRDIKLFHDVLADCPNIDSFFTKEFSDVWTYIGSDKDDCISLISEVEELIENSNAGLNFHYEIERCKPLTVGDAWDILLDGEFATAEELILITKINGYSMETLESVLYARTALRDFDQLEDERN